MQVTLNGLTFEHIDQLVVTVIDGRDDLSVSMVDEDGKGSGRLVKPAALKAMEVEA